MQGDAIRAIPHHPALSPGSPAGFCLPNCVIPSSDDAWQGFCTDLQKKAVMDYKDYYKILGVPKNASQDEIKRAYRKLAAKHHPDRQGSDTKASKRFTDIGEAYEVLKDPEKRKLYDKVGANWKQYQQAGIDPDDAGGFNFGGFNGGGRTYRYTSSGSEPFGGSGFSDFFESIFGGGGYKRGSNRSFCHSGKTKQTQPKNPGG
jgi:DnaJ-class molecular chaperone